MSGMWSRWARVRRIVGLSYMGGAAVAIAVAVLLFTLQEPLTVFLGGALMGAALGLVILAGIEFWWGWKYARLS